MTLIMQGKITVIRRSIRTRICVALLTIFSSGVGFASEVPISEIAKCAALNGDLERLECYDELARTYNADGPQSQPVATEGNGGWRVSDSINPIDDSRTVVLAINSENAKSRWGKPVSLIIRCQSNKTELYITWNDYLGREAKVLTRVGEERAITKHWSVSTDSQASFYPRGAIGFIKSMMSSDRLVAQVTPYNESSKTAIFETAGLNAAVLPLRETCSW